MRRLLYPQNIAVIVSLLLLVTTAYLVLKSWIVRDEIYISREALLVVASDSGRIEFAYATCSTGTPAAIGGGLGLIKGAPTVYSQRLEFRHRSMLLNHIGLQSGTWNYYGSVVPGSDVDLGPRPLVNDVTAVTIPTAAPLILFAILPALRLVQYLSRLRGRRIE